MQQDPDAEPITTKQFPKSPGSRDGFGADSDNPDSPGSEEKQKKKKKDRTPEETERKRGEIVDFYLERMVREVEKDVEAAPDKFYHVNFFCRKPLKEVWAEKTSNCHMMPLLEFESILSYSVIWDGSYCLLSF